jgi:hypothetical protein
MAQHEAVNVATPPSFSSVRIVSDSARRSEFDNRLKFSVFRDIARRVNFLSCEQLVKDYEYEVQTGGSEFPL